MNVALDQTIILGWQIFLDHGGEWNGKNLIKTTVVQANAKAQRQPFIHYCIMQDWSTLFLWAWVSYKKQGLSCLLDFKTLSIQQFQI